MPKLTWNGTVTSVQPRIRLHRSFDQRSHSYLGYVLRVDGAIDGVRQRFRVAVGPAVLVKHMIRVGDELAGQAEPVADPTSETAEFYKVAKLRIVAPATPGEATPPPWTDLAPPLETYRARGHRRLDPRAYEGAACSACKWGARMPVDITVDQWNPQRVHHRTETFCYGPLSCSAYRAGPTRKVPGRNGMSWEEADWVDEEAVRHRAPNQ